MKLSDWAKTKGISYLTAWRWFNEGAMPENVKAYQTESGTIIVESLEPSEPPMPSNQSNDSMSLFLKKTVEFSKNNSSIEDFAAYVLSNFNLKLNNTPDASSPRYSKNKPKSEDVQKHFQKFIKPKNEDLKNVAAVSLGNVASPEMQSLINDLSIAIAPVPNNSVVTYDSLGAHDFGDYEGVVSRYDNPQSTNYTFSTNSTLVTPINVEFNSEPQPSVLGATLQPSTEEISRAHEAANKLAADIRSTVKPKRGRKPSKVKK